jgi:hypothetical protein
MVSQKSTKSIKVRPWTYGQITRFASGGETIDDTLTRILVLHQKTTTPQMIAPTPVVSKEVAK